MYGFHVEYSNQILNKVMYLLGLETVNIAAVLGAVHDCPHNSGHS